MTLRETCLDILCQFLNLNFDLKKAIRNFSLFLAEMHMQKVKKIIEEENIDYITIDNIEKQCHKDTNAF